MKTSKHPIKNQKSPTLPKNLKMGPFRFIKTFRKTEHGKTEAGSLLLKKMGNKVTQHQKTKGLFDTSINT